MNYGKLAAVVVAIAMVLCLGTFGMIFEGVDSGEIVVIQAPLSGELTWHTTPGTKWQGWGKVTTYKKQDVFWFSPQEEGEMIKVRFNDNGHADIEGSITWELPYDEEKLTLLHSKYGSQEAVEKQLVRTVVENAIYMSGPLMSSTESGGSRRNELLSLIEDQIENGVYQTKTLQRKEPDPITGEEKVITVVEIVKTTDGQPKRAKEAVLEYYGIKTTNPSIRGITYEANVEAQIAKQQEAIMSVQIAIVEAKRSEQEVLTTKKQGEADAAKAEWAQKTIAAKATEEALMKKQVAETEAEMKLAVAELDKQTAQAFKESEQLRGEGEAARKKAVMEADGALEKKLEAYVKVNEVYAKAIGEYQGAWQPVVVMGSSGAPGEKSAMSGAQQLIDLLTAKTAKDLSIDLGFKTTPVKPAKPATTAAVQ